MQWDRLKKQLTRILKKVREHWIVVAVISALVFIGGIGGGIDAIGKVFRGADTFGERRALSTPLVDATDTIRIDASNLADFQTHNVIEASVLEIDGVKLDLKPNALVLANTIRLKSGARIHAKPLFVAAKVLEGGALSASGLGLVDDLHGESADELFVYAEDVRGTRLEATGFDGRDGKKGATGARGPDGRNGRSGRCGAGITGDFRSSRSGDDGGRGYKGGKGGSGGDAGSGGTIYFLSWNQQNPTVATEAGERGMRGPGGDGGPGGNGGRGGRGCSGVGGSQPNRSDGNPGPQGSPGDPGDQDGEIGQAGNLFAPTIERDRVPRGADADIWRRYLKALGNPKMPSDAS
ncbi:MAG: hypothetical protein AAF772_03395 [Acidobacteriota bacterium]